MYDKRARRTPRSNAVVPNTRKISDEERAALLRFEQLFENWRVATEKALSALEALWGETLQPTHDQRRDELAREAEQLRDEAMALYAKVLETHRNRAG
jgi:hypothetical protein